MTYNCLISNTRRKLHSHKNHRLYRKHRECNRPQNIQNATVNDMWHANKYPYSWNLPGGITKSLIWDSRFWGSDVTLECPLVYKHNCKDPWAATHFSQHGKYFKYFQKCLWFPMCPVRGSLKTWMRCFRSKLPFTQICSCVPEWVGSYWFNYSKISLWSPSHCRGTNMAMPRSQLLHYNKYFTVFTIWKRLWKWVVYLLLHRESWLKWYTSNFSLGGALFDFWSMHQPLWPWYFIAFISPSIKLWEITLFGPWPLPSASLWDPTCQYHVVTDSLRTATDLTSQPRWQGSIWDGCSSKMQTLVGIQDNKELVCGLLCDVSISGYITSMNDKLKGSNSGPIKVLFSHPPWGGGLKKTTKSQCGQPVSQPRFELSTPWIQAQSLTYSVSSDVLNASPTDKLAWLELTVLLF